MGSGPGRTILQRAVSVSLDTDGQPLDKIAKSMERAGGMPENITPEEGLEIIKERTFGPSGTPPRPKNKARLGSIS